MNNNKIIWIGIQESELQNTNHFFYGSITIFGSGKNGNYSFEKKNEVLSRKEEHACHIFQL